MQNDDNEVQTLDAAREQALDYLGFARPKRFRVGDEVVAVPNPSLLSRDVQRRYNEIQLALETLDRWPDTKNEAGEIVRMGEPKMPYRRGGQLVDTYDEMLTEALLGKKEAERLYKKGLQPSDIGLFWSEMNARIMERSQSDSKSVPGAGPVEGVPAADQG